MSHSEAPAVGSGQPAPPSVAPALSGDGADGELLPRNLAILPSRDAVLYPAMLLPM